MKPEGEKFKSIASTGRVLFWKHGIKRVSIEEICQEAGVSKMTFYKHFRNKTELARHLLEEIFEAGMVAYKDILKRDVTYEEKARQIIAMKMGNLHGMSQELIDDIYKNKDEELCQVVESIKNRVLEVYLEDFREAQHKGQIRPELKPEFIVYFMNKFTEMITDENLIKLYPDTEAMLSDVLGFFFYGIMARRNES